MMTMNKYIFLMVLGLTLSFGAAHAQDWVNYRANNCLCKIKFPAKPEIEQEQKEGFKSNRAIAEYNGAVFLFEFNILPTPMQKDDAMIFAEAAVGGFSGTLGATITKQKTWKVDGWEGLRTEMEIPGEGATVYYYTVLVRSINYQIAAIGSDKESMKIAKKFIKSFKRL